MVKKKLTLRVSALLSVLGIYWVLLPIAHYSGAGTCVLAQMNVRVIDRVRSALPAQDRQEVVDGVSDLLRAYERTLETMVDRQRRGIDDEAAKQFEALFTLNAKVVNDLRSVPEDYPVGVRTYVELIDEYFLGVGIHFNLTNSTLRAVTYAADTDRYAIDLRVVKSLQTYYTEGGEVVRGNRRYALKMQVTYRRGQPSSARIAAISLANSSLPADYVSYAGIQLTGQQVNATYRTTDLLLASADYTLTGRRAFGAGLFYQTNAFAPSSSGRKNLHAVGRLGVARTELSAELSGYSARTQIPVTGQIPAQEVLSTIERSVRDLTAAEAINLTSVQAGIGLAYRLTGGGSSHLFVSAEYAPGYLIAGRGDLSGSGRYDIRTVSDLPDGSQLVYSSAEDDAFRPGSAFAEAYDVGDRNLAATTDFSSRLNHGANFSLTFLQDFSGGSSGYGLGVGLNYYLPITQLYERQAAGDIPLIYSTGESAARGLTGVLDDEVMVGRVGIWVAVYSVRRRR